MYSSWLLISSCLTNLLNSLNVSQSSGVPDCLALSCLLFFFLISLLTLLMFLFTHGASHLLLSVLCGMCFSVDVRITLTNLLYISSADLVLSFSVLKFSSKGNHVFSDVFNIAVLVDIYPPWFLLSCFGFHIYYTYNYFVVTHSSCCGNGCDEVGIGRVNKV